MKAGALLATAGSGGNDLRAELAGAADPIEIGDAATPPGRLGRTRPADSTTGA